ncbi:hypothetical protein [Sulfurimonas sp.]|uniref:hypothetical protein n=1 Tax=Sulfurimonas sp. TaxID=2022749 RepID=UPI003D145635
MSVNLNTQLLQRLLNMAVYANEVSLLKIDDSIADTQKKYPTLVTLFSNEFFKAIHQQLSAKKLENKLYLQDLKMMQKEFNLKLQKTQVIELSDEDKEFENMLITAISEISTLIEKLDIKMKILIEKKGENNGKDN